MTKLFATATAAAALIGTAALADIRLSDSIGPDFDRETFGTGFAETGYFDALDRDGDSMLGENEYATGLYADYDMDNDVLISEDEFATANTRYYGETYEGGMFADYDLDGDGFLNQGEFREFYGNDVATTFADYDADRDGMLNADEYANNLYETADADRDAVVTIEEEGFFEGWFDGDDIEAEIETVGDVM
ncbi:MAG: EF-hand domain-containing protein [Hasllibacter sp.]